MERRKRVAVEQFLKECKIHLVGVRLFGSKELIQSKLNPYIKNMGYFVEGFTIRDIEIEDPWNNFSPFDFKLSDNGLRVIVRESLGGLFDSEDTLHQLQLKHTLMKLREEKDQNDKKKSALSKSINAIESRDMINNIDIKKIEKELVK